MHCPVHGHGGSRRHGPPVALNSVTGARAPGESDGTGVGQQTLHSGPFPLGSELPAPQGAAALTANQASHPTFTPISPHTLTHMCALRHTHGHVLTHVCTHQHMLEHTHDSHACTLTCKRKHTQSWSLLRLLPLPPPDSLICFCWEARPHCVWAAPWCDEDNAPCPPPAHGVPPRAPGAPLRPASPGPQLGSSSPGRRAGSPATWAGRSPGGSRRSKDLPYLRRENLCSRGASGDRGREGGGRRGEREGGGRRASGGRSAWRWQEPSLIPSLFPTQNQGGPTQALCPEMTELTWAAWRTHLLSKDMVRGRPPGPHPPASPGCTRRQLSPGLCRTPRVTSPPTRTPVRSAHRSPPAPEPVPPSPIPSGQGPGPSQPLLSRAVLGRVRVLLWRCSTDTRQQRAQVDPRRALLPGKRK